VHIEDVVGGDRGAIREAVGLGCDGFVGDEAERRAAARRAIHLQEEEVVASCQEPHPLGGDVLLADGAPHAVEQRAKVILWTHPAGV